MRRISILCVAVVAFTLLTGCVPGMVNSYRATVLDGSGQESVRRAVIEIEVGTKVEAYGECFPRSDRCRIVIWLYYPKTSEVAFSSEFAIGSEFFAARGVKSRRIYGTASSTSGASGAYGDKRDATEEIKVFVVDLGETVPKEIELTMPPLRVDGVKHEIPIISFKHSRRPGLEPAIVNY